MAYPSGLTLNETDEILYVCETLKNRILKIYVGEDGNYATTIFH